MNRPRWDRYPDQRTQKAGSVPRPWVADCLTVLAGLGFGVSIALVILATTGASLSAPGGWFNLAGRVFAMAGTYSILIMMLLIARLPGLERAVGHDKLVHWHRRLGGWPVLLIGAHILFTTLGYAAAGHVGPIHQLFVFFDSYPEMVKAFIGTGLLGIATALSIPVIRRAMAYEKWWAVHLLLYAAVFLSFFHQEQTSPMFIGHPLATAFWTSLFVITAIALVLGRVLLPVLMNVRLGLRVERVEREADGVVSIVMRGRNLERLAVTGGQFFQWRFLDRALWFHAHPYSLSALPRPPYIRITVKDLGDHSAALAGLRAGTRVFVEGPYGTFTQHRRETNQVTLIGAGVGVTPLRAILDDLPGNVEVSVIVRASREEELIHGQEIAALVGARGGSYIPLVGSRELVALDARRLRQLVPNIGHGDVYLCGPEDFIDTTTSELATLGVLPERIHSEIFAF